MKVIVLVSPRITPQLPKDRHQEVSPTLTSDPPDQTKGTLEAANASLENPEWLTQSSQRSGS